MAQHLHVRRLPISYRHARSDKFDIATSNGVGLLGVKLDNQLSVDVEVNLITVRKLKYCTLELIDQAQSMQEPLYARMQSVTP